MVRSSGSRPPREDTVGPNGALSTVREVDDQHGSGGPRLLRSGSTSQGLLLTLLGDYWSGERVHIPSGALVELLGDFGVTEHAARAALSRIQRAGWVEGHKSGRRTAYRLSEEAAAASGRRGRQILAFSAETPDSVPAWDRTWNLVSYSLSADRSEDRRRIRRRLRLQGYAPLQDALWLRPWGRVDRVVEALAPWPDATVRVFSRAELAAGASFDPVSAWGLDALAAHYAVLADRFEEAMARLGGDPHPREGLVARTRTMEAWAPMRWTDPRLPIELLPAPWPGWEARRAFVGLYDPLGPVAAARVREVVERYSRQAADAVRSESVVWPR